MQCLATIAITRAMRTTASDVLEAHANILPIELLLADICYRTARRMMTLPKYHPFHRPVRICARRLVPSSIHQLKHRFNLRPDTYEVIVPFIHPPDTCRLYTNEISISRRESREYKAGADVKVFADGSGLDGNAGAAAVLYRQGKRVNTLRDRLSPLTRHTT